MQCCLSTSRDQIRLSAYGASKTNVLGDAAACLTGYRTSDVPASVSSLLVRGRRRQRTLARRTRLRPR
eukprot:721266-Heterocapsa_arctica.AAC.1